MPHVIDYETLLNTTAILLSNFLFGPTKKMRFRNKHKKTQHSKNYFSKIDVHSW